MWFQISLRSYFDTWIAYYTIFFNLLKFFTIHWKLTLVQLKFSSIRMYFLFHTKSNHIKLYITRWRAHVIIWPHAKLFFLSFIFDFLSFPVTLDKPLVFTWLFLSYTPYRSEDPSRCTVCYLQDMTRKIHQQKILRQPLSNRMYIQSVLDLFESVAAFICAIFSFMYIYFYTCIQHYCDTTVTFWNEFITVLYINISNLSRMFYKTKIARLADVFIWKLSLLIVLWGRLKLICWFSRQSGRKSERNRMWLINNMIDANIILVGTSYDWVLN